MAAYLGYTADEDAVSWLYPQAEFFLNYGWLEGNCG